MIRIKFLLSNQSLNTCVYGSQFLLFIVFPKKKKMIKKSLVSTCAWDFGRCLFDYEKNVPVNSNT